MISNRISETPGKVVIYGWHLLDGSPIQPVYSGHIERYADYSHGIRFVARNILVDGVPRDLYDVLRDPLLAPILSSEGGILEPSYPTRF